MSACRNCNSSALGAGSMRACSCNRRSSASRSDPLNSVAAWSSWRSKVRPITEAACATRLRLTHPVEARRNHLRERGRHGCRGNGCTLFDAAGQLFEKEGDAVRPAHQGGATVLVELRSTGELLQHGAGLFIAEPAELECGIGRQPVHCRRSPAGRSSPRAPVPAHGQSAPPLRACWGRPSARPRPPTGGERTRPARAPTAAASCGVAGTCAMTPPKGCKGLKDPRRLQARVTTRCFCAARSSLNWSRRRDFPIPGSPETVTSRPDPFRDPGPLLAEPIRRRRPGDEVGQRPSFQAVPGAAPPQDPKGRYRLTNALERERSQRLAGRRTRRPGLRSVH